MGRLLPSHTAELVCFIRAAGDRLPADLRIVDDPHARWFVRPLYRAALGPFAALIERPPPLGLGLAGFVLCRHRFIDDQLRSAIAAGGAAQVVLLGAGYDTRAYRFAGRLGDRPLFEVDLPMISARKARLAARASALPRARVIRVQTDFRSGSLDRTLLDAGLDPRLPSLFIWEGVSMYLTARAVRETLEAIRRVAGAGSRLVADFWGPSAEASLTALADRLGPRLLSWIGEPVDFTLRPPEAAALFEPLGYRVTDLADAAELSRRYVRNGLPVYRSHFVVCLQTLASG